eukprot:gene26780-4364_t
MPVLLSNAEQVGVIREAMPVLLSKAEQVGNLPSKPSKKICYGRGSIMPSSTSPISIFGDDNASDSVSCPVVAACKSPLSARVSDRVSASGVLIGAVPSGNASNRFRPVSVSVNGKCLRGNIDQVAAPGSPRSAQLSAWRRSKAKSISGCEDHAYLAWGAFTNSSPGPRSSRPHGASEPVLHASSRPDGASVPVLQATSSRPHESSEPVLHASSRPDEASAPVCQATSSQPHGASVPVFQASSRPHGASVPVLQASSRPHGASAPVLKIITFLQLCPRARHSPLTLSCSTRTRTRAIATPARAPDRPGDGGYRIRANFMSSGVVVHEGKAMEGRDVCRACGLAAGGSVTVHTSTGLSCTVMHPVSSGNESSIFGALPPCRSRLREIQTASPPDRTCSATSISSTNSTTSTSRTTASPNSFPRPQPPLTTASHDRTSSTGSTSRATASPDSFPRQQPPPTTAPPDKLRMRRACALTSPILPFDDADHDRDPDHKVTRGRNSRSLGGLPGDLPQVTFDPEVLYCPASGTRSAYSRMYVPTPPSTARSTPPTFCKLVVGGRVQAGSKGRTDESPERRRARSAEKSRATSLGTDEFQLIGPVPHTPSYFKEHLDLLSEALEVLPHDSPRTVEAIAWLESSYSKDNFSQLEEEEDSCEVPHLFMTPIQSIPSQLSAQTTREHSVKAGSLIYSCRPSGVFLLRRVPIQQENIR